MTSIEVCNMMYTCYYVWILLMLQGKQQQKAGEIVNPDDVLDLNANAKELRKAHSKLRNEVERYFGDFKHIVLQVRKT